LGELVEIQMMITLNKKQIEAVETIDKPLIITAGPGSGKTRVLIEKIKYLIKSGYKDHEILALTFSKKAAFEIEDRLSDNLGFLSSLEVSTFHAFCEKILRENANLARVSSNFVLMDQMEAFVFMKEHIFDFKISDILRPASNPYSMIDRILTFISKLEDEYISPLEFSKFDLNEISEDERPLYRDLQNLYTEYFDLKIKNSRLEFNDVIFLVVDLFSNNKKILKKYQERYKYILVDEYQDTNYIQNLLITYLASEHKKITVVGDRNQSIYKFRGAALSNFNSFEKNFPDFLELDLKSNYRSYQDVSDAAFSLFNLPSMDSLKGYKKGSIEILNFEDERSEIEYIKDEILKLHENGVRFSDIAILLRSNIYITYFKEVFEKSQIPFYTKGSISFTKSAEIKDLIALVRFLEDQTDDISFFRVLNISIFNLQENEISQFIAGARENKLPYFTYLEKLNKEAIVSGIQNNRLNHLYEILNNLLNENVHMHDKVIDFLDRSSYFEYIHSFPDSSIKRANIDNFIALLLRFRDNGESNISKYIQYIDKVSFDEIETGTNYDGVTISTVHGSKGTEYDYVFLPYLVKDRFPSREKGGDFKIPESLLKEKIEESESDDEEKRLFFVGVTRTKEKLYLSYSNFYEGLKREKKKSEFLDTIVESNKIKISKIKDSLEDKADYDKPRFIIPKKLDKKTYSYTQISEFKRCPLQYYYDYILKIPKKPNSALFYGTMIHSSIKRFFDLYRESDRSLLNLQKEFTSLWDNSDRKVFENKIQEDAFKNRGLESLKTSFKMVIPEAEKSLQEESFYITLDRFNVMGRIDRVDFFSDNTVSIIDYKTGKSKSQDPVDQNLQLTLYAIAAESKFKRKIRDLSLQFIDEGVNLKKKIDEIDLEKNKRELIQLMSLMEEGEIRATPSYMCNFCDYINLCYKM
jgi:DNA helicase-2/ATP-dependent DNA helicase PcrA